MSGSIYSKKFYETLLGDKETREIGAFIVRRFPDGHCDVVTKEFHALDLECRKQNKEKKFAPLNEKAKKDKTELRDVKFEPITDEELDLIE